MGQIVWKSSRFIFEISRFLFLTNLIDFNSNWLEIPRETTRNAGAFCDHTCAWFTRRIFARIFEKWKPWNLARKINPIFGRIFSLNCVTIFADLACKPISIVKISKNQDFWKWHRPKIWTGFPYKLCESDHSVMCITLRIREDST